ncbi:MAG: DUF2480 family protein [Chitinophagaceae bacterium]|nr:DUF2480 family protein [Chitinophagaceae bacterium]MCB9044805.1 DUF2480 family protein [Chitinophagales bacterium]
MDTIVNKVAESGIITLDLAAYLPEEGSVVPFDIKPFLFREMILKEKDFRDAMKEHDWTTYKDKYVAIYCSADAIVPVWAYMLISSCLQPFAASVYFGTVEEMTKKIVADKIGVIDTAEYVDKRVVLKGCGDKSVPEIAYVAATEKLRPVVKSLMYGEPCSTVPIYKQPLKRN